MNELNVAIAAYMVDSGAEGLRQLRVWEKDGRYYCTAPTIIEPAPAKQVDVAWDRRLGEYVDIGCWPTERPQEARPEARG